MANWDRSILGQEFARTEQQVTHEMLFDYANMMGTTNPIYLDPQAARAQGYRDIIALPTFITLRGAQPLTPPAMEFTGMGINAGYDCTFYGVIYPGDTLVYSTCLADWYEKTGRSGTMRFVVRETTVTNQHGTVVAVMRNAFILDW
jgi:acyl dehydratase